MLTFLQRIVKSMVPKTAVEAAVLCIVAGVLSWMLNDLVTNELATRRGTADAQADIAHGIFRYNMRGLARHWHKNVIQIAQRDYGIQIERTGGCVCGGPDCSYDHAYNKAVQDHFTRKLGYDPIDRAFERARLEWEKTRNGEIAAVANIAAEQKEALEPAAGPASNGGWSAPAR